MSARFPLEPFDWAAVDATRAFITSLYAGPAPCRPGCLMHLPPRSEPPPPPPPAGLGPDALAVWNATESFKRRPLGRDDYVPAIGTGAGACALATAFGCREVEHNRVFSVAPCLDRPEAIDGVRMPAVTAGKLGRVLEQTRAVAACADPRLPVRIMDFQSPFTTVEQMLGSDAFFLMPYDHPGRLHALMDLVTDFSIAFFKAQVAAAGPSVCPGIWPSFWFPACAGIQMSDDNMVNVSPEVYDEFVVPYNNRVAEAFGGLFLHSCTIREENLPSIRKLRRLTGLNCDIGSSVSTARLLEVFGDAVVVAPHCYINTQTRFPDYAAFMAHCLAGWQPGKRLFIHPCSVMYRPDQAREIRFDAAAVAAALKPWRGGSHARV